MIFFVYGGAACGKSEVAESLACTLRGPRCYIATLEPYDHESDARIEKHIRRRANFDMKTLECFGDLRELDLSDFASCMLEDTGNLMGNLLFHYGEERGESFDEVMERASAGIDHLFSSVQDVLVVGNEVFSFGAAPTPQMRSYMKAISLVSRSIAQRADCVMEVVFGIPLVYKGVELLREHGMARICDMEVASA